MEAFKVIVSRVVVTLAAALLGVVVPLPASAADLTAPKQTERRLLGQSIDRPVAASTDAQVTKTLGLGNILNGPVLSELGLIVDGALSDLSQALGSPWTRFPALCLVRTMP